MLKKNLLIILIASFAFIISSCKTHERCPAYGKADVKTSTSIPA